MAVSVRKMSIYVSVIKHARLERYGHVSAVDLLVMAKRNAKKLIAVEDKLRSQNQDNHRSYILFLTEMNSVSEQPKQKML